MHITIERSDGQRPFTLCGARPTVDDIPPISAMFVSREFLEHVGVCSACVARYRYPDKVRLPLFSGKVREQRP